MAILKLVFQHTKRMRLSKDIISAEIRKSRRRLTVPSSDMKSYRQKMQYNTLLHGINFTARSGGKYYSFWGTLQGTKEVCFQNMQGICTMLFWPVRVETPIEGNKQLHCAPDIHVV
eukprot:6172438-Pleurochrysis_carterae.AAC.2